MNSTERYANALKEVFEAEKAVVNCGLLLEGEAGVVNSEAYFAQRYVRVQSLLPSKIGQCPKNWDVKTFEEIEWVNF